MSPPRPRRSPDALDPGWEPLYHAVGAGMCAFSATRFRTVELGAERLRWGPGTVVVATHRTETDVPLAIALLYKRARLWREGVTRLYFAARDDMFLPGFFSGFVPGLPPLLRRALWRLSIARGLRAVRVSPVGAATSARLAWLLAQLPPHTPLDDALPVELAQEIRARASARGLPPPSSVGAALDGRIADAVWRSVDIEGLDTPAMRPAWRRRAGAAAANLRGVVTGVRAGHGLLLFPEGRPSPDGAIGPLRGGVGTIVRRGRARALQAMGIAYDPLTRGRTRAVLALRAPIDHSPQGLEERILGALRAAMPLTCAQVLGVALREAASEGVRRLPLADLDARLEAAVAAAGEEGRDVDPPLRVPRERRERLSEALSVLSARGLVAPAPGAADLWVDAVRRDALLSRLAREHDSARATAAVP